MESHSYCFLFGAGGRLCPGKELGMVKVSTFLHYFVTKYRFVAFLVFFGKSETFAKEIVLVTDGRKLEK